MSTIYIDITKYEFGNADGSKDPVTALVGLLSERDAKLTEKFAALQAKSSAWTNAPADYFDLLLGAEKLVVDPCKAPPADNVEQIKTDRELYDAYYSVIFSILLEVEKPADQVERVGKLADSLASPSYSELPELRLKQLMVLYNSIPAASGGQCRFLAFQAVLRHAKAANMLAIVRPYIARIDEWHKAWGITQEKTHELYLQVADCYKCLDSSDERIKALYTLLDMYEGADKKGLQKHGPVGVELLSIVIESPQVLDFTEFLGLAVVRELRGGEHKKLVEMVDLLSEGNLGKFLKEHPKGDKFFTSYNLTHESCLTKMRLLTLANTAQAGELKLSDVATALRMDEKEAEHWVVRAVSTGILNARVDQIKRVVLVKSAFERSSGQDQWQQLDTQLESWISNLKRISGVLAATRAAGVEAN
jgi:translation initiation factor 3 subunit M